METDLVPCVETLAPELLDLMRLVFRANHKERSTALELMVGAPDDPLHCQFSL